MLTRLTSKFKGTERSKGVEFTESSAEANICLHCDLPQDNCNVEKCKRYMESFANLKGGEKLKELSEKILNYRAKHNLSMKDFATLCGVTLQTIYNIENKLQTPSKLTKRKIELVLKENI